MNGKHTPGPWNVVDGRWITSDKGDLATTVVLGHGRKDEMTANARLIAAAPELLVALDQCRAALRGVQLGRVLDPVQLDGILGQARAAMAKATGGQASAQDAGLDHSPDSGEMVPSDELELDTDLQQRLACEGTARMIADLDRAAEMPDSGETEDRR